MVYAIMVLLLWRPTGIYWNYCAKYHLGARCGVISSYGKIPYVTKATGQFLRACLFVASHCCDSDQG